MTISLSVVFLFAFPVLALVAVWIMGSTLTERPSSAVTDNASEGPGKAFAGAETASPVSGNKTIINRNAAE